MKGEAGGPVGLRRLAVVLGTGGVGKTTISLALAMGLAGRGCRVLLLTVDPARRLYDLVGKSGATPDGLVVVRLETQESFRGLVTRYSESPQSAEGVLGSRFFPFLSDHLPGLNEYVTGELVLEAHDSGNYDYIVLDTPPFSHALHYLEAPLRLGRMASTAMAIGAGPRGMSPLIRRGLSLFLGGGFLGELLDFVNGFGELWPHLQESSKRLASLYSEETSYIGVMVPEARCTDELLALADGAPPWLSFGTVVVNRSWVRGRSEGGGGDGGADVVGRLPGCACAEGTVREGIRAGLDTALALASWKQAFEREALRKLRRSNRLAEADYVLLPNQVSSITGGRALSEMAELLVDGLGLHCGQAEPDE